MKNRGVLCVVLLLVSALAGQTFRGGVEGTVSDSTGAVVSGAQVTIASAGTGFSRTVTTDDQGNYLVSELPLGVYTVTASKQGFRTTVRENVKLEVSARERVDFQLQPGEVKETIVVKEELPLVETTVNNMGGTIEGDQAKELPINGRDFTKLLVLVPGTTGDASGATDSPGSFGLFSTNGNRGRSNNYLLDGTDMNDGYRNLPAINEAGVFGTPATILPVDALAEVPVISNGEAEYGRNSGAIVNLVTRSGTNHLHGTLYEYFRNDHLDARNWFNKEPQPQNLFLNNQFGGSLGGSLVKDKTFFFVSYEGQREKVGLPFTNHIPTQEQLAVLGPCGSPPPAPYNPIVKNIICTVQPWGAIGSLPATGEAGADVQQSVRATNRVDSFIGKIDQHVGKGLLTGRYFFGDSDQSFPLALLAGGSVPGFNTVTPTRVQVLSLSYTHVHSSRLLMEARGGWNRFFETFSAQDSGFDPASAGLNSGAGPTAFGLKDFGLPLLKIGVAPNTVYAPIGANAANPRGRVDTNWQAFGNMSYASGRHNLKWGYEFRRTSINGFFDNGYRGVLNFASFDDFLQGNPAGFGNHQLSGDSRRHTFQNNHAFYVQDNWRVRPNFTVNLGLRWDYYGVIGEKNGLFSLFDPASEHPQPASQLYPKDYNNFGPRVSFAWDPWGKGKTVIRGGYGVYYDAYSQDFFLGQLPWPTFNSGPAYNYVPSFGTAAVLLSYSPNSGLGLTGCGPGTIPVPNSGGLCAMPTFNLDPSFGNDSFTVAQNLRTPYVQNYNLNVQQELSSHLALQVGYVGSAGRKLFHYRDINQPPCLPDPSTGLTICTGVQPFPNAPGFLYVLQFESSASSGYNSLQASLKFRDWHGLTSTLNYVWSHSIDTASDGQDYVPNASQPDDSSNPQRERANSNFDQRHRLTWNFLYQFPEGHTAKWITSGWAISGVLTVASGMPYNVNWINNFTQDFNGTFEFYGRPDVCGLAGAPACPGGITPFSGTGGINILNLAALSVPCTYDPSSGGCDTTSEGAIPPHIGNLPRNAFLGPNYRNFDFSLIKNTRLGERVQMQWRADFFNILNHPNFTNPLLPNFSVDMTQNGLDSGGHGVGFLQPTATPDVGTGNPFLGGGGPRNIQIAVKFSF